jgi:hypothetical protein
MKKWYESKLVWLGVIQTVIGILGLLATFLEVGDFAAPAVVALVIGALTVVLRIWFTDTAIA